MTIRATHARGPASTILLVEDEESFVEALTIGLKREGFLVHVARDGVEALDRFDAVHPDLVLLDVMLPSMSGIEVCRQLRTYSTVPIIMVSAKSSEIDTVVGLEVGADDYVAKPDLIRELVARMRAALRRVPHSEEVAVSAPDTPGRHLRVRHLAWRQPGVHRSATGMGQCDRVPLAHTPAPPGTGVLMASRQRRRALTATLVLTAAGTTAIGSASAVAAPPRAQHVLLISVDGLHQSDLDWYVTHRPGSALAALVGGGVEFTGAQTQVPSDSFPGMVAQVTGGNPSSTGVYYDDSFNRALIPAGTTTCTGAAPGAEVTYFEQADKDPHALDAGQGLPGLPYNILAMTGDPRTVIDPTQLPVDPSTCAPVYPHSYLKVNTIFEVARAAGLRTAWVDKHPAYEILNGPSGAGIQDLFTPEINSDAPTKGASVDWTKVNSLTQQYDTFKVQAVLNETYGYDHAGRQHVGTPAIYGMNFQSVSTAQKLPTSGGQTGGYLADGVTPGPVLSSALDFVNGQVGRFVGAVNGAGLASSTVIVLSAKHGQSPDTPSALTRIPDGPIMDGLNAAWRMAAATTADLVAFAIDDDGVLLWLNDRSPAATDFARSYLLGHSGVGNDINGAPKPYTASGLTTIYAGAAAAAYFGVPAGDARVPDVFGIAQYGVVYTGGKNKIAEHGGANPQDRSVALVVSGGPISHHGAVAGSVETTQIAPTILTLLGLDPGALQAVAIEHTAALPVG